MKHTKRLFTREISFRDETPPGMKSFLSIVKCLLLFVRFRRDELIRGSRYIKWVNLTMLNMFVI